MPDDDALEALAYHEQLLHEQWLLLNDPEYQRWLDKLEQDNGPGRSGEKLKRVHEERGCK